MEEADIRITIALNRMRPSWQMLDYTKCYKSPKGGETTSTWKDPGKSLSEGSIGNGSGRLGRISEVRVAKKAINSLAKHKGEEARWCLENSR